MYGRVYGRVCLRACAVRARVYGRVCVRACVRVWQPTPRTAPMASQLNVGGGTAGQARHNSSNVGGVTAALARHNSSNVGGVTADQVKHNSSNNNDTIRNHTTRVSKSTIYYTSACVPVCMRAFVLRACGWVWASGRVGERAAGG